MSTTGWIVLGIVVVFVIWAISIYNGLVALRENVRKAWANIDVLLTQRHDELPKLVETCKRYMAYEQDLRMPFIVDLNEWQIRTMEELGRADRGEPRRQGRDRRGI